MDILYIEARFMKPIKFDPELFHNLPTSIALVTTVSYVHSLYPLQQALRDTGRTVIQVHGKHSCYPGQLLGCDIFESFPDVDCDAFLYVGDGMFHPKALLLRFDKPVYRLDPHTGRIQNLNPDSVKSILKRKKGALLRFYASKQIGLLLSTKPGQYRPVSAYTLQRKYPEKIFYIFINDTYDFGELENFPFIECFVNTACPRIAYDDIMKLPRPIVDVHDL